MSEKFYLRVLDIDARKRHYHIRESGRIIKFVVQLEVKIKDEWKEVVRYDCAHDYTHIDIYNIKGQRKKIELYLNYKNALILADDDINKNWEIYKEKFLKGIMP